MIQKCCATDDKNCCCNEDFCCIDTNRIYDTSRTQDCIEGLRVILTPSGMQVLENCRSPRAKEVRVIWTQINTEEMPFNSGYYQVTIRYYFYVVLTCCVNGTSQDIEGLAISEKTVVLYGGEGNVSVFISDTNQNPCYTPNLCNTLPASNRPKVVVEVATPIPLAVSVVENCNGIPLPPEYDNIPEQISCLFDGGLDTSNCAKIAVCLTLGIFALVRIERPSQLIIPACDYCIPDTDKSPVSVTDPCSMFCNTPFPIEEFYPSVCAQNRNQ
ncbi:MAG: hypothetical protein E7582_01595 [Ruminococcaceae bacterium]|nr:hypothetical protein [Oscillospiraceae bacterium]